MASLSKAVYNLGIANTIIKPEKKCFLALLNSSDEVLAYSKFLGKDIAEAFDGTLKIKSIPYQSTASITNLTAAEPATKFAVVRGDTLTEAQVLPYTGGTEFTGPSLTNKTSVDIDPSIEGDTANTSTKLQAFLIGELSANNQPQINANSNFLFSGATITFSES